jgi:hypothetical protein
MNLKLARMMKNFLDLSEETRKEVAADEKFCQHCKGTFFAGLMISQEAMTMAEQLVISDKMTMGEFEDKMRPLMDVLNSILSHIRLSNSDVKTTTTHWGHA